MTTDPRATYTQFLQHRRNALARLQTRHRGLGYIKLATAALGLLVVYLAVVRTLSIAWILIPIAAFVVLVVVHGGVLRAMERLRRAARYFETGWRAWMVTGRGRANPAIATWKPNIPTLSISTCSVRPACLSCSVPRAR